MLRPENSSFRRRLSQRRKQLNRRKSRRHLRMESLEDRRLLAVNIVGQDVPESVSILNDPNDASWVMFELTNLDDQSTQTIFVDASEDITFEGNGGNDLFTVDLSNGDPLARLANNGGSLSLEGGADDDSLLVENGSSVNVRYDATGAGAGTLSLDGGNSLLSFSELEPIVITTPVTNVAVVDSVGAATASLTSPAPGTNLLQFSGGLESIEFGNPSSSFSLDIPGSSNNNVTVDVDPSFTAPVSVFTDFGIDVVQLNSVSSADVAINGSSDEVIIGDGDLSKIGFVDIGLVNDAQITIDNSASTADATWSIDSVLIIVGGTLINAPNLSVMAGLTLNAGDGDDTLIVNDLPFSLPLNTSFDGGGQGAGGDSIVLNGNANTVVHTFADNNSGDVDMDGRVLTYTGLEPILDNLNAVDRDFIFLTPSTDIELTQSVNNPGTHTLLDSGVSESVEFTTPSASLDITLANGGDNVLTATSFSADYNTPENQVFGGDQVDTYNIEANPGNDSFPDWRLFGGAGNDIFNVSPVAQDLSGFVDDLHFEGDAGADTINVFDNNFTGNRHIDFNGTFLDGGVVGGGLTTLFGSGNLTFNATETINVDNGSGNDVTNINSTATGTTNTFRGWDGDDTFNIPDGSALQSPVTIIGGNNDDRVNATLPNATGFASQVNVIGGADDERDSIVVTDQANVARPIIADYDDTVDGLTIISGLGSDLVATTNETLIINGDGAADQLTVWGTTDINDDIGVVPRVNSAQVFLGGQIWTGPADGLFDNNLPGTAGGGIHSDLVVNGIDDITVVTTGNNAPTNDQLIVFAPGENDLIDPNSTINDLGLGNQVLIPGLGTGNAFDDINISENVIQISNNSLGALLDVDVLAPFWVQNDPNQAALIVNAGSEAGTRPNGIADDITLNASTLFKLGVNGQEPVRPTNPPEPVPTLTGGPNYITQTGGWWEFDPERGDRLQTVMPGELNIFSDLSNLPEVSLTSSDNGVPVLGAEFSSIEIILVSPNPNKPFVNLIGDNNAGTAQDDEFIVVGTNVDGNGTDGGQQEFKLMINGSSPINVDGVRNLNVLGREGADTFEVSPYTDNTPVGWGIDVLFDEGATTAPLDLLIYNTAFFGPNVSEDIVVAPSGEQDGEIRVTNGSFGTPIVNISYANNLDIIVNDNDGSQSDTDTLTLRGTNADNPTTVGLEDFDINFGAAGNAAAPVVVANNVTSGNPLYRVRAAQNITAVQFDGLSGVDRFDVTAAAGTTVNIEGGNPRGSSTSNDELNVITGANTIAHTSAGSAAGTFQIGGGAAPINYDGIESLEANTVAYITSDPLEPNNAVGTATFLGSVPAVTILGSTLHGTDGVASATGGSTSSDVDVYEWVANRTGLAKVTVDFTHAAGDLRLQVRDSANNPVVAIADSATDDETSTFPVVAGQSYFVVVDSATAAPNTYSVEIENYVTPRPESIDLQPANDSGSYDTDDITNDALGTIEIQADLEEYRLANVTRLTPAQAAAGNVAGVAVQVFVNGTAVGFATPTAPAAGGQLDDLFRYTFTAGQLPADDVYEVEAAVYVVDGQTANATGRGLTGTVLLLELDATAPATNGTIDLATASDSFEPQTPILTTIGTGTDNVTNDDTPHFTGTAEPNAKVRLYANAELVGETIVDPDGTWQLESASLVDGPYAMTFQVEDVAGNVSTSVNSVNIVIDTLPPQRPTIDLHNVDDTGASDLDNVTAGDPTQAGRIVDYRISAENGTWVQVKDGETIIRTLVFNNAFDNNDGVLDGFGNITVDFDTLQGANNIPAEGPHILSVEAFDVAGNRSAQAEELVTEIDTIAPATPGAVDLDADADSGVSDTDNVTNVVTPTFNGLGEANSLIRIFATNVDTGQVQEIGSGRVGSDESDGTDTDGLGTYSVESIELDEGRYNITATFEDLAGNISAPTAALQIEIDSVTPNTAFIDLREADDSGRHNDDNITNVTTPIFTVTTEDPNDNLHIFPQNLWYRIFDRPEGGVETLLYTSNPAANAAGLTAAEIVTTPGLLLSEGHHNLKVEVEDRAGNISDDFFLTVVIDTVAPPVSIIGLLDSDSGVPSDQGTLTDRVTNRTDADFVGRAEADAIVRLYVDGREGVNNDNNVIDNAGEFSLTMSVPLDGDDAFPNGQWETTFIRDLNDGNFFDLDGVREVLATAEDVAGNVSNPAVLDIFIDTAGPRVTNVQLPVDLTYDLFDPKPSTDGPTPLTDQLLISVSDLPLRSNQDANFLYSALFEAIAENPGNYSLVGDATGNVGIESAVYNAPAAGDQTLATGTITLTFSAPLPDDRFTLVVSDILVDPAGNGLDGETNTVGPLEVPQFSSGDGTAGGAFVGRFTIDTRPEIGVWAGGTVWVDTNGNFVHDPTNADHTNDDITYVLGLVTDDIFAGNFAENPGDTADGFDKVAAYGSIKGNFRWLIDIDNDGVINIDQIDPNGINGLPVAGRFDSNDANGDEVALYTGRGNNAPGQWAFDTDHDFVVDTFLTSDLKGYPIVGDFNGDGYDDLGAWTDDTFQFDLTTGSRNSWDGTVDAEFRFGFIGVRERPVAADMNMDGWDDVGLWVPDREGQTPRESGEFYFLVSNNAPVTARSRFDAGLNVNVVDYHPTPFGNDLYMQFGDDYALPVVGNFDPPVSQPGGPLTGPLNFNTKNIFDVNGDGRANARDIIDLVRHMQNEGTGRLTQGRAEPLWVDVNQDGELRFSDLAALVEGVRKVYEGNSEPEFDEVDAFFGLLSEDEEELIRFNH